MYYVLNTYHGLCQLCHVRLEGIIIWLSFALARSSYCRSAYYVDKLTNKQFLSVVQSCRISAYTPAHLTFIRSKRIQIGWTNRSKRIQIGWTTKVAKIANGSTLRQNMSIEPCKFQIGNEGPRFGTRFGGREWGDWTINWWIFMVCTNAVFSIIFKAEHCLL